MWAGLIEYEECKWSTDISQMHLSISGFAFDGYDSLVSVGKSTVPNALLGDKFSQVALKRTTAGVNFFHITQPTEEQEDESKSTESPSLSYEWSVVDYEKQIREADEIHQEISKDNEELRCSDTVKEKTFHIQVSYPLCKMRKDTRLVLIDILNGA